MAPLTFEPPSRDSAEAIEAWFEDPDTRRRLGDRGWVHRLLRLTRTDYDDEVLARHAWSVAQSGAFVALVDVEVEQNHEAWLALVVCPDRRGHGLGQRILRELEQPPELASVLAL